MQRRDSTCIFYDILYVARRGATKKRIRRQLGMTSQQWKERIDFLLIRDLLKDSCHEGVGQYSTTVSGYRLLYHMTKVDEVIGEFFPHRPGLDRNRRIVLENELTELQFDVLNHSTPPSYAYTIE